MNSWGLINTASTFLIGEKDKFSDYKRWNFLFLKCQFIFLNDLLICLQRWLAVMTISLLIWHSHMCYVVVKSYTTEWNILQGSKNSHFLWPCHLHQFLLKGEREYSTEYINIVQLVAQWLKPVMNSEPLR